MARFCLKQKVIVQVVRILARITGASDNCRMRSIRYLECFKVSWASYCTKSKRRKKTDVNLNSNKEVIYLLHTIYLCFYRTHVEAYDMRIGGREKENERFCATC